MTTLDRAKEAPIRHGHVGTPTYFTWSSMNARCSNPKNTHYASYGGRGIKVCEKWRTFLGFLDDMGYRPPGRSLDRINNDMGYEPGNCRWATPEEQANNQQKTRRITHQGRTLSLSQWERELGISRSTIKHRLDLGRPMAEVLSPSSKSKPLARHPR